MIGNVGPIGCIPYQKTINQVTTDQCVKLPNELALQYNAKLRDMLTEMNDNMPGATFLYANTYDLVMDLITNYKQYGTAPSNSKTSLFLCYRLDSELTSYLKNAKLSSRINLGCARHL